MVKLNDFSAMIFAMNRVVRLLSQLQFWPFALLITAAAVLISEVLVIGQSYWLTGDYFDKNLLTAGFITPAVDGFILISFLWLMIGYVKRLQQRLEDVQSIAHIGFWEMDPAGRELYISDEVYRILGITPKRFETSFEQLLEYVHPEDRDILENEHRDSVAEKRPYKLTHRVIRADGEIRYVEEKCRHTYDKYGRVATSIGTVHDVTDRIMDATRIRQLFDLQTNIVVETDGRHFHRANKALLHFFGFEDFDAFFRVHTCICDRFLPYPRFFHMGKVPRGMTWPETIEKLPETERIVAMQDREGQLHSFSVNVNRFNEYEFIVSFTDITDTINENRLLNKSLVHDTLTQAYNRKFLEDNIERLIRKARESNNRLGVILFDIDHFKKINDSHGHDVGDEVLKTLVSRVKRMIRREDLLIRWGGEEFLLFINIDSQASLMSVAEGIHRAIAAEQFDKVGRVTCSFGVAVHDNGNTFHQTFKKVDSALYKAKTAGRNRIASLETA